LFRQIRNPQLEQMESSANAIEMETRADRSDPSPPRRQIQIEEDEDAEVLPQQPAEPQQQPPARRNPLFLAQFVNSYELLRRTALWRKSNFGLILYFIPLTFALTTVLIIDWQKTCHAPLKIWAIVQVAIQTLSLAHNTLIINKLPPSEAPLAYQQRRLRKLYYHFLCNRVLSLVWFIWYILGMVWTFHALSKGSCPNTAPFLFRMCLAVVIIQLVVLVVLAMFCCCACLMTGLSVFIYVPGENSILSRGATDSMIRALPTKKYADGVLPKEDSSCAICLSDYETSEVIRILPCQHHFHSGCVDQWLITNKSCPFCKQEIDADNPKKMLKAFSV